MNDHSKDSQTRYFREAAIVLAKEGFQLDEVHTDRLCILLDGAPLCEVTESGGIAYRNKDIYEPERIAAKDKVYEIVRTTAEYIWRRSIFSPQRSDSGNRRSPLFHTIPLISAASYPNPMDLRYRITPSFIPPDGCMT